jgi:cyclin H
VLWSNHVFAVSCVVIRLRHLKAKKALREEREQLTAAAANGSIGMKPVRKPRSFASLLPASTTATRDINDWNDAVDIDIEVEEQGEEKLGLHVTPLIEYLSLDQEKLMREFYEAKVQESCTQLFRSSDKVKCCAVMLYKRFYLSNSVMEFHPKFIVPTVIYVAGKVEEQYINVDTIAEQLQVDHKHVIGHEMLLLEGVRFQLIMYHPFRALLGFVDDFRGFSKAQGRTLPLDTLQKLHTNSCVIVNELLLTEAALLVYPAFLSLFALIQVAEDMETDAQAGVTKNSILEYVKRSKFAQG